jgi:hypothetical protein
MKHTPEATESDQPQVHEPHPHTASEKGSEYMMRSVSVQALNSL